MNKNNINEFYKSPETDVEGKKRKRSDYKYVTGRNVYLVSVFIGIIPIYVMIVIAIVIFGADIEVLGTDNEFWVYFKTIFHELAKFHFAIFALSVIESIILNTILYFYRRMFKNGYVISLLGTIVICSVTTFVWHLLAFVVLSSGNFIGNLQFLLKVSLTISVVVGFLGHTFWWKRINI